MADIIITEDNCDSIRRAIDVRLDDVILPNEIILDDIYAKTASEEVASRFGMNDLSGDQTAKAIRASCYLCASYLIPAIKQVRSEQISGNERSYDNFNYDKKAQELKNRSDEIVNGILIEFPDNSDLSAVRPIFFRTAKARRPRP